jgi:hypothetical protein
MDKETALQAVEQAAADFRELQEAMKQGRERFIDAIMYAHGTARATQQEIAERCFVDFEDPDGEHLSRQRVSQYITERKRRERQRQSA